MTNLITFKDFLYNQTEVYNQMDPKDKQSFRICPTNLIYKYQEDPRLLQIVKQAFHMASYALVTGVVLTFSQPNTLLQAKIWGVAKWIFPIALYNTVHSITGLFIVASSFIRYFCKLAQVRDSYETSDQWNWKRFTVDVEGYKIDAFMITGSKTAQNGRWILYSNNMGTHYENHLEDDWLVGLSREIQGNLLLFNYPCTGAGNGVFPRAEIVSKAYRAMLTLLEDKEKGIGAKEIIAMGHSLGTVVQGDALKKHQLKEGIKYLFIKSKGFIDMSHAASDMYFRPVGFFLSFIGWNLDSVASSKQLKSPEIIIQTARVSNPFFQTGEERLKDISKNPELIIHDGLLSAPSTLAAALMSEKEPFQGKKIYLGENDSHGCAIGNYKELGKKILEVLKESSH